VCGLGTASSTTGSVSSRTWCNCCNVHGGSVISPRESQRRTTGGVTLHTEAAWRTEVTSCQTDAAPRNQTYFSGPRYLKAPGA
jgi:hypothetical protein